MVEPADEITDELNDSENLMESEPVKDLVEDKIVS